MGKQQFPKIPVHTLPLFVNQPHRHIAQGQALHLAAVRPRLLQGNQGTGRRDHRVTQLRRHSVTVSGGPCGGIGTAAGRQDHLPGRDLLLVCPNAGHLPCIRPDLQYPALPDGHTGRPRARSRACWTLAELSDTGKTRLPRSVFSGQPSASRNSIIRAGGYWVTAL